MPTATDFDLLLVLEAGFYVVTFGLGYLAGSWT
jgi:hypothetical protein